MNRDLTSEILSKAGCVVDVAADGASALHLADTRTYDVILMDIQMAGMDGLAVTRQIRNRANGNADIPIIAMTANVMPDQIARFTAAGMSGAIGKPFKRAELLDVIANAAGQATAAQKATSSPPVSIANTVFDETAMTELSAVVGIERVAQYAGQLQYLLMDHGALAKRSGDLATMQLTAHRVATLAGQLGFHEIAETCRNLETACMAGDVPDAVFEAFDAARIRAVPELQTIFEKAEQRTAAEA